MNFSLDFLQIYLELKTLVAGGKQVLFSVLHFLISNHHILIM
jgi:hypothetical protein